jgi:hypothetical protein
VNGFIIRKFVEEEKVNKKIRFISGKTNDKSFMNKTVDEKRDRYRNLSKMIFTDFIRTMTLLIYWERQIGN